MFILLMLHQSLRSGGSKKVETLEVDMRAVIPMTKSGVKKKKNQNTDEQIKTHPEVIFA